MSKVMTFLWGLGLGAGLMYFYDPDRGTRRRALVRDKAVHLANETTETLDRAMRDVANRTQGLLAEATSLLTLDTATDETLEARVRARMGHLVSNPHAIHVSANQGRITLSGPILAREEGALLAGVTAVRGVQSVDNRLDLHTQADIPALQHKPRRPAQPQPLDPANWSPTARLVAGAAGGLLTLYGARRKGLVGAAIAPLGLGLLTRTIQEEDMYHLFSRDHDPLR